ncbi:hypothetical protein K435DRAFT_923504 [Dendrothele bispora CBS 962.96]|uniref:Uncharacterized protein n=1 Tax=Dendrothele bispora (strain CBS 962.96) TaxID=1314807 RepID=A0A4S8LBK5_DENBC|nr:hypothetical protein K435DRAFT_923504 [Dendrothele bispora CBS 962.96]
MSSFFQNTSHSSFDGSHITNTARDHTTNISGDHTTNVTGDHNICIAAVDNIQIIGSQVQIVSNGVRGESIFNQYRDFRRGDIRLLQELSTTEIDEETSLWSDRNPTKRKLKYIRTAHSVSLFGVAGNYSHCVAIDYSGQDTYAAWKRDLLKYSNQYGPHHPFNPVCFDK